MKSYLDYQKISFVPQFAALTTGITMAYYEFGQPEGEPMVLLHGITDGCVTWSQMIEPLVKAGYHLYILEYRGNGLTDKPEADEHGYTAEMIAEDVLDWMRMKNLDKVHLVGHSYGSIIAQCMAAKKPALLYSCILIDTALECKGSFMELMEKGNGDFKGMDAYEDYLPKSFCSELMTTTNEDPAFRKAVCAHAEQIPAPAFRHLFHGLKDYDGHHVAGKICGNVLVIWGTEDDVFTAADQDAVDAALTNCKLTRINVEGGSHNGFWDSRKSAQDYAGIIDQYIRSIEQDTR